MASAAAVVAGAVIAAPRLIDRVDSDDTQSDAVILGEQVDADAWVEFKDPDGAFSVQLPRTPDRAEATSPVAAARTTTVSYVARNGVAAVGVTKIVSADNAPFDPSAAAASKAESIGATLTITATGTDPAGRSYVEGRMENDTIQVLARWIANGATGYLLQVVASFEAPSLATFTRLVASFQIIA